MSELEEKVEAQGGVLLAHTALIASVIGVLKESGRLSQAEINSAFDAALTAVENAPVITDATTTEARVYLEDMARQFAGPRAK